GLRAIPLNCPNQSWTAFVPDLLPTFENVADLPLLGTGGRNNRETAGLEDKVACLTATPAQKAQVRSPERALSRPRCRQKRQQNREQGSARYSKHEYFPPYTVYCF